MKICLDRSLSGFFRFGFVFLALVMVSISCSKEDDDAAAPATCETSQAAVTSATYTQLWTNVFSNQCGTCHGPGTNTQTDGGPDLRQKIGFYSSFVGKTGNDYADWDTYQRNRAGCLSYEFVKSGSASESVVVAVLDSSVSLDGCTVAAHIDPPQNICITDTNLTKLKEWIDAGAAE